MTRSDVAVGIDVGQDAAWLVAVEGTPQPAVVDTMLAHPLKLDEIHAFCTGVGAIAIDAPSGPSARAHEGDARLSPKFQRGRCGEVALARTGIFVPWTSPPEGFPVPGWISAGFEIWEELLSQGLAPLETYPHGIFWRLAGRRPPQKQRPTGSLARLALLNEHLRLPVGIEMWGHDGLDALAAAFVGWLSMYGRAERIDCSDDPSWPTHDGSSIWLPYHVVVA